MFNNLKQAFKEVFSFAKKPDSTGIVSGNKEPDQPARETGHQKMTAGAENPPQKPPAAGEAGPGWRDAPRAKYDEKTTTIITASTVINGTITTDADLKIAGKIEGNVEGRHVAINGGKIFGDLNCTSTEINGARIEGNIAASELVDVGRNNDILGNISANQGKIAGRVQGDVIIEGDLDIEAEAVILGDVTANLIGVQKGAALKGNMNVRQGEVKTGARQLPDTEK